MDGRGQAITCAKADVLFLPASPQWKWGAIDWINTSDKTETWLTSINSRLKTIIVFFVCPYFILFLHFSSFFVPANTHTCLFSCPACPIISSTFHFNCLWVGGCVCVAALLRILLVHKPFSWDVKLLIDCFSIRVQCYKKKKETPLWTVTTNGEKDLERGFGRRASFYRPKPRSIR